MQEPSPEAQGKGKTRGQVMTDFLSRLGQAYNDAKEQTRYFYDMLNEYQSEYPSDDTGEFALRLLRPVIFAAEFYAAMQQKEKSHDSSQTSY